MCRFYPELFEMRSLREIISRIEGLTLVEDVAARRLTTMGAGSNVPAVVRADSVLGIRELQLILNAEEINLRKLGSGSNVVLPDEPLGGILLTFGKELGKVLPFDEEGSPFALEDGEIFAFAGAALMPLSRKCSSMGLAGLEFASGIPASIGGALKMNCGAHGSSISEVVSEVMLLNAEAEIVFRSANEMRFSYRSSGVGPGEIVLGAKLKLRRGLVEEIQEKRQSCLDYRKKTQPLHLPSSGSVFKNPPGEFAAAYYLEQVQIKGERIGGVEYSERHSNWIVRVEDHARAEDVRTLIELGQKRVFSEFGIMLTPELLLW